MAFSYTRNPQVGHAGNIKIVTGTFTNSGSTTGGDIDTGLQSILFANAAAELGGSVVDNNPGVARSGGTLTLTTDAGDDGTWIAIGI